MISTIFHEESMSILQNGPSNKANNGEKKYLEPLLLLDLFQNVMCSSLGHALLSKTFYGNG